MVTLEELLEIPRLGDEKIALQLEGGLELPRVSVGDDVEVDNPNTAPIAINETNGEIVVPDLTEENPNTYQNIGNLATSNIYYQASEPSETPVPKPSGPGGVWYPSYSAGDKVWQTDMSNRHYGLAVDNGVAIVGISNGVAAVDMTDGSVLWKRDNRTRMRTVTISNNIAVGGDPNGKVFAVEMQTGRELWSDTPAQNNIDSVYTGTVDNQEAAVLGSRYENTLVAYSLYDGTKIYEVDNNTYDGTPLDIVNNPGGGYYVGFESEVVLFTADDTPGIVWDTNIDVNSNNIAYLEYTESNTIYRRLYVGSNNKLKSLDAIDGSVDWTFDAGSIMAGGVTTDPVNDRVFCADFDDTVYAFDPTGTKLWEYSSSLTSDGIDDKLILDNGTLVVPTYNDGIIGLDADSGNELWTYTGLTVPNSNPVVEDNVVLFGTDNLDAITTAPKRDDPKVSDGSTWVDKLP